MKNVWWVLYGAGLTEVDGQVYALIPLAVIAHPGPGQIRDITQSLLGADAVLQGTL